MGWWTRGESDGWVWKIAGRREKFWEGDGNCVQFDQFDHSFLGYYKTDGFLGRVRLFRFGLGLVNKKAWFSSSSLGFRFYK